MGLAELEDPPLLRLLRLMFPFTLGELLSNRKPGSRFCLKCGMPTRSGSFVAHRGAQSLNRLVYQPSHEGEAA
jgi:hypothetical protein